MSVFTGLEKGAAILELLLETQCLRSSPPFGGLPFSGPPSILTAIVKQFTSVLSRQVIPFSRSISRRSPAMRFALLTAVVAIGALACGKKGDDQSQSQMSAPPAAPAAATTTGPVVEV